MGLLGDFMEGRQEASNNLNNWMNEALDGLLGPTGIPDRLRAANLFLNPAVNVDQAQRHTRTALDPSVRGADRALAIGQGLLEVGGLAIPAIASRLTPRLPGQNLGDEAARAMTETFANMSSRPEAAALRDFGASEAGNVPTNRMFHGGVDQITSPKVTMDSDGLLPGFSVTPDQDVAASYARLRGGNAISEFDVDPAKLNPIGEFDLYDLTNRLEMERGLGEGDLTDIEILAELKSMGINAVQYSDPNFGLRVLDTSVLTPSGLLGDAPVAEAFDMQRGANFRPLDSVDLPAGSDPRYRGAAPNRTTPYERYQPKKVPPRMERLVNSLDDPASPVNVMVDGYIEKGIKLKGNDWYNTEELRDWAVEALGEAEGDKFWRDYMLRVGNSSTGNKVPQNIRVASFYQALSDADRAAVSARVAKGGITPGAAARELGIDVPNMPDDYNYGHVMQSNHAKNVVASDAGEWAQEMPTGLMQGEKTAWRKANPKVKGFTNDLMGDETNIAADKHFMRMLAMQDGGADFLGGQAALSVDNRRMLKDVYGDALDPYTKTRNVKGKPVVEMNLAKAAQDGVITDTSAFREMPTAWADTPSTGGTEYAALEEVAQRLAAKRGMTPAQLQANMWMGAGDITGLADESQGTFMELFRVALDKRAADRGIPRAEMLMDFLNKRSPLAVAGALPLGLGLLGAGEARKPEQEGLL